MKTNAVRLMDEAGIDYELLEYALSDEEFSGEAVAESLNLAPDRVFKSLIAVGELGPLFAIVPASSEVDLKRLAAFRGERRMSLAPLADVHSLTGYRRGTVTVLGAKRAFPVVIDEVATLHETIAVSAGAKGLQVLLSTQDYLSISGASFADIAR